MSTKEAIVRILAADMGMWLNSYDLVQRHVGDKFTGIAPMERAYDIVNKDGGIFESPNYTYYIEHRGPHQKGNTTKYAQFRCSKKELRPQFIQGVGVLERV